MREGIRESTCFLYMHFTNLLIHLSVCVCVCVCVRVHVCASLALFTLLLS